MRTNQNANDSEACGVGGQAARLLAVLLRAARLLAAMLQAVLLPSCPRIGKENLLGGGCKCTQVPQAKLHCFISVVYQRKALPVLCDVV